MTVTIERTDAEVALSLQERAVINRLNGLTEAADQLEALARSLLKLPTIHREAEK